MGLNQRDLTLDCPDCHKDSAECICPKEQKGKPSALQLYVARWNEQKPTGWSGYCTSPSYCTTPCSECFTIDG